MEISADAFDLVIPFLLREKKLRKPIFNSVEDEGAVSYTYALEGVIILVVTEVVGANAVTGETTSKVDAATATTANKALAVNFILGLLEKYQLYLLYKSCYSSFS
ncbi:MAG: hypothetical protein ACI8RD_008642 [Bacillariaceae sp.]